MKDESKHTAKYGNRPVPKAAGSFLKSDFTSLTLLFVMLLQMFSVNGFSQIRPGVTFGYSHAIFGGPDAKAWGFMDVDPQFAPRFHIGGFIVKGITENLHAEPGLSLATKGTKYMGEMELYDSNTSQNYMADVLLHKRLLYLDIPLNVRYYLTENFNIVFGPEISFLLLAKAIETEGNKESIETDVREEYNSLDLGIRLALSYYLTKSIYLQFGYIHGLTDIVEYEYYDVKNRQLQLSLAYVLNPIEDKKR